MNPSALRGLKLALALFLAAVAQSAFADAVSIRGAQPDLLLLVGLCGSLFADANGAAALGFFAGLFHAAVTAPPMGGFGSLIVSRTLACIGIGLLEDRLFRDHPLIALLLVTLGTALAEALFFLFAPQPNLAHWARAVGLTTLYNAALAIPAYLLLRRFLGLHKETERF